MTADFDRVINRRGTGSLKHDGASRFGIPDDALPMWVADMDFPAPLEAVEAARRAAASGIYGYTIATKEYGEAAAAWHGKRYGWTIREDWIQRAPGVMYAIAAAVRAFTSKGDAVLAQEPVYHCFAQVVRLNGRRFVSSDLMLTDGRYEIDFDDFERKVVLERVRMFLLCHPHNPAGRAFSRDELERLGSICLRHGVLVVSDEIHGDFVYKPREHIPFASVGPEFADRSIVMTAPSKTFNMAGLHAANVIIPDAGLRARMEAELTSAFTDELSSGALAAAQAAYEHGGPWLEELKEYIQSNCRALEYVLTERIPAVRVQELQATYLAWLDFRALGLPHEEMRERVWRTARVWLSDGLSFGEAGQGFMRMNLACPRSIVMEAAGRLSRAFR